MRRDTQGELPNEEIFIEWYLNNNSYTLLPSSPANRSPAMHLMRHLAELVLELLSRASIPKVMTVYETLKSKAKAMKNLPLCTKHLLANQLHNGVESLLARTVSPESLIEVLVGPAGILNNLIGELKESFICDAKGNRKWDGVKEIDCTDKFTVSLPM